MQESREPSSELLVVRGATANRLKKLVETEPEILEAEPLNASCVVLRVRPRREARAAWEQVQKELGPSAIVTPVLVDSRGHAHYPTGSIQVRFHKPPSDEALETFAKEHTLRLVERNHYQPAQANFEMTKPDTTYLPDVIAELSESSGVRLAWADAEARYQRY